MKPLIALVILLLLPTSLRNGILLLERWDTSPEYVGVQPFKLEVKRADGEYEAHVGPYAPKGKLSYAIERVSTRTVTAKTTRRIVQKVVTSEGTSRTPIYTYMSPPNGTRVDANQPGKSIVSHVTIELPDRDVMPPGKGYIVETSIEFPAHGERNATTYTGDSMAFDVE